MVCWNFQSKPKANLTRFKKNKKQTKPQNPHTIFSYDIIAEEMYTAYT